MIELARSAYHAVVPSQLRRAVYRTLHQKEMRNLRHEVFPSAKGTFSLRGFDRHLAIFVHTPKAAGTSVALSLFGELPYHYTAADYRAIFGRVDFNRYFKFAFVRNPWDRLLSAYSYLSGGGWDEADRLWASVHLASYESFESFVHEGLRSRAIREYMHFRPQSEFITNLRGRIVVDFLGRFETIERDFQHICARMNVRAELPHTNKSNGGDYREVYTPAMRDIVANVYRADIRRLGYAFDGSC